MCLPNSGRGEPSAKSGWPSSGSASGCEAAASSGMASRWSAWRSALGIASGSVGGAALALPFLTRIGGAFGSTGIGAGSGNGSRSSSSSIGPFSSRGARVMSVAESPPSPSPSPPPNSPYSSPGSSGDASGRSSTSPIARQIAAGSGRRPGPKSPQAIGPASGSSTSTPKLVSSAMLRRVAGCSHILTFIAGTASTGLSVASSSVVARSSATPAAILASRSALAGQTTTRSA